MMKKLILLASVLTLVLVLTACGGSDSNDETKAEATTRATKTEDKSEEETGNSTTATLSYATVEAPSGWEIVDTTVNMAALKQVNGNATMKVWCSAFTAAEEFVDGDILGFKEAENIDLKKLTLEIGDRVYYGYHPDNDGNKFVLACDAKKGYVEINGDGITIEEATEFIQSIQVVEKVKRY